MSRTAADVIIDRLIEWEVQVVFGLPGDSINGLMEALRTRRDHVRFVQVRHEEAAAFMACAYAKSTGRLGVCLATSGPGAIHLLNGLYDAKKDSAPVLALTGQTYHDLLSTDYHQEVDLLALYRVARALSERLAPTAIVTTDCGTITTWAARHITIKRGQHFSCSGNLATMACGLPYAIAAQVAYPKRQCVAFVGDGGFTMLMGEFATAVKYRLPLTVVVLKNDAFAHVQWEQMALLGNPQYECELQPIDFAAFATACGGLGVHCERPEELGPALDAALRSNRPALVEVVVDPLEPPMPPRVSLDQTVRMGQALLRGTERGGDIARTLIRNTLHELGRRSGRPTG